MSDSGMMLLSQAAKALDARMIGKDVRFDAVSTDSRKIKTGDLFIALRGENFDGYEFAVPSMQTGAVAVMVNADSYEARSSTIDSCTSILLVEDTHIALGRLAAYWRSQFDIPLAAVTGSNGKTTVKEMLASILRAAAGSEDAVLATKGNFNNDIGMPLTLLQLNARHRYAVIEMGMNHPGEIDYLSRIASPDVALVNNASGAHLEGLGSVEAVARAKGEIFGGLRDHGTAVINADDAHAPLWRTLAGTHDLIEFALDCSADVCGKWQPEGTGLRLNVQTPQGEFNATLQVPGAHNARNALAATAAAIALNVPLATIADGLQRFAGVTGRLQRKAARQGATLIDDTYNANPASMRAAIGVLAQVSGKRVLVLGDMGELGDGAAAFHAEIGGEAKRAGIEKLYALGELSRNAVREFGSGAQHFERIEELLSELDKELDANTTVLVKGSRFMKMERVVQHCIAQEEKCCSH
ncbi:UDP-N-acetylmuramoyl-tripeptide--D-alanyl-D-alanine ligase [Ferrigenium kumadai]|uniref:UDP-N-acetylmuramoyl-tripeptide--D-alanyl-D-alanine ligase n=1 Tax=Ferrigenium kumadai TaxID=1682490 RepID=A0AAN1T2B3_9PROT|nr:UDP-N-acetylmuramoyl-tripeptide--D-alanyl-D-alanine ligase [Ferrigenium kumadai]BBJ00480.1 UDP-N-acetylmuramoyl-tripeptide--D-alanyl-D-alanine ligase [Ferrigenium kumadai]